MKYPRRRLAFRLAACAAVGAVLTAAIAWGCAAFLQDPEVAPTTRPFDGPAALWADGPWFERSVTFLSDVPPEFAGEQVRRYEGWRPGIRIRQQERSRDSSRKIQRATQYRFGWPFGSLELWEFGPDEHRYAEMPGLSSVVFPIRPIGPGFALDTAFYGTLAFLLWSAPGFIRRQRRRRRGQCLACGYELKAIAKCPECGREA